MIARNTDTRSIALLCSAVLINCPIVPQIETRSGGVSIFSAECSGVIYAHETTFHFRCPRWPDFDDVTGAHEEDLRNRSGKESFPRLRTPPQRETGLFGAVTAWPKPKLKPCLGLLRGLQPDRNRKVKRKSLPKGEAQ